MGHGAKGKGRHQRHQGKESRGKEAKRQRSNEKKERKKNGSPEGSCGKKQHISTLSVPQIMHIDLFLCDTTRHNQHEPQPIVAQRVLFGTYNT